MSQEAYNREKALVTAFIIQSNHLNGTIYQTFDQIYDEIAPAFIEAFPLDTNWEEMSMDYDEYIDEFTHNYLMNKIKKI